MFIRLKRLAREWVYIDKLCTVIYSVEDGVGSSALRCGLNHGCVGFQPIALDDGYGGSAPTEL